MADADAQPAGGPGDEAPAPVQPVAAVGVQMAPAAPAPAPDDIVNPAWMAAEVMIAPFIDPIKHGDLVRRGFVNVGEHGPINRQGCIAHAIGCMNGFSARGARQPPL